MKRLQQQTVGLMQSWPKCRLRYMLFAYTNCTINNIHLKIMTPEKHLVSAKAVWSKSKYTHACSGVMQI